MGIVEYLKYLARRLSGANVVIQGLDNQRRLIDQRTTELLEDIRSQSGALSKKLEEVTAGLDSQSRLLRAQVQAGFAGVLRQRDLPNEVSQQPAAACDGESRAKNAPVGILREQTSRFPTNDLAAFKDVFAGVKPWSGEVPSGFVVDFLGMLVDIKFNAIWFSDPDLNRDAFDPNFHPDKFGGQYQETKIPQLADAKSPADAEAWFEAVDWVELAREARGRYVMITLGANYGAQAVGAYRALQAVNPMPYKLVAVDPVPGNLEWIRRHMSNNGIDPDEQWIVPLAISNKVDPLFFPVGGPGIGSNNCYSTNELAARKQYAEEFIDRNMAPDALRNLLLNNTTGLMRDLVPGHNLMAEIKLVSSITLNELLAPFENVDLLEFDIQQSEILVFPGFIDVLRRKVRRIHIGTHGEDVHSALHNLFAENGWEIVFSYKPNSQHESSLGNFSTNDGVLTVRNPKV